mmetsp:Transcript_96615/g.171809  ORF Transcript_96615/g.171809 Transcript_96615/m.171809 type:complete len:524 (-) Transcript_96615:106-1677(-)
MRADCEAEVLARDARELVPPPFGIATQAVYAGVLGSFLYGYMLCHLNSCGDFISLYFRWCDSDLETNCLQSQINGGLINAILYLGAAAGALLIGRPFIVQCGSRNQLIISDAFFIIGGFLGGAAQSLNWLLLSRLLSGVGLGISAIAAPLYIAEVSPVECRGFHSAKHGLYIAVGLLAAELVGLPQDPPPGLTELNSYYWRLIMALPMFVAALQMGLLRWDVPIDPASFLVQQGKMQEARTILYRTYGLPSPGSRWTIGLQNVQVAKLELRLQDLAAASAEAQAIQRITIAQAIGDPYLRCSLIVGFFLASYQQLTGINALMAYSNGLFAQAGIPSSFLTLASVGMCVVNVMVSVLSTKLVDSLGRRTLLLWGATAQTLAMAAMVYFVKFLPATLHGIGAFSFFSLFVVSWNYGLGAITWLWLSEVYPMEIRGPALSACGVIKWLSCFTVVLGARFLNLHSSCVVFGTVSGIGLIGMWLWVLETKGCDMEDSPMTPRSERSNSVLLGPGALNSPRTEYAEMKD